jgi:hypothetical protein
MEKFLARSVIERERSYFIKSDMSQEKTLTFDARAAHAKF